MIGTPTELEDFFRTHGPAVEHALNGALAPPAVGAVANLHDGMRYGVGLDAGEPGKRVRPLLALLTSHAVCGQTQPAVAFAVAIELMHSFALVHDDIEDGDQWRRGRPAVWKHYGLAHGINIGDGLLNHAFLVLAASDHPAELKIRLVTLLAETLNETIQGQALDMNARIHEAPSVADYMDLVTRKTGRYLAAPLVGGALVAGAPEETVARLAALGPLLGPLFQILDDLIDLSDGKGRESTGNDVREGKRSYLAVHTLAHAQEPARRRLLEILNEPRGETTDAMVAEASDLMRAAGAMDAARTEANRLRTTAQACIRDLQPPALASALGVVLDYLAGRRS